MRTDDIGRIGDATGVFDPENRPRFQAPPDAPPEAGRLGVPDPDCCAAEDCPQRDFNRSIILAMEKLTQAHAVLWLMQEAAQGVWPCNAQGHTADCPDPSCTFSALMQGRIASSREKLEVAVVTLFRALTTAAIDLEAEWEAFFGNEMAGRALLHGHLHGQRFTGESALVAKEALRQEAVGYDPLEHTRWFRPPPGREGGDAS